MTKYVDDSQFQNDIYGSSVRESHWNQQDFRPSARLIEEKVGQGRLVSEKVGQGRVVGFN